MKKISILIFYLLFGIFISSLASDFEFDKGFSIELSNPAYVRKKGPLVFIDRGHFNWIDKGFLKPFIELLEQDGYKCRLSRKIISGKVLKQADIFVICNPISKISKQQKYSSAFTTAEISVIKKWVYEGGSFFLIVDHAPLSASSKKLAKEFGFLFPEKTNNIYTITPPGSIFSKSNTTLSDCAVINGRSPSEKISELVTFVGQIFQIPSDAVGIMVVNKEFVKENRLKYTSNVEGFADEDFNSYQGAYKLYGKGRIVVIGEAAMFAARINASGHKLGMNSKIENDNAQFLLNIIHYLDGLLD